MKILHVADQTDPRMYKQALAQQDAGDSVAVLTKRLTQPDLASQLILQPIPWAFAPQAIDWADVVHVHTTLANPLLPIEFTHYVISLGYDSNFPLVWDIHDLADTTCLRYADSVIVPSHGYADRLDHDNVHVVYSKPPLRWEPDIPCGGYDSKTAIVSAFDETIYFRDYRWCIRTLLDEGHDIVVYSAGGTPPYADEIETWYNLPIADLYAKLRLNAMHWVGASNDEHSIHDCVTNKFWDGLACGCVPLFHNCQEMEQLYLSLQWTDETNLFMESELPALMNAYDI